MQKESNMSFCSFTFHILPNTAVLCNAEIPNNHILLVWENTKCNWESAQPKLSGKKIKRQQAVGKCSILHIQS